MKPDISIRNALFEMTDKRMGMTTVTDKQGNLLGIFTDGDLRRAFERDVDIDAPIEDVMTKGCKTVKSQTLAVDAVNLMEESSITSLIVVDNDDKPLGVIHMHDLLKAGVV